MTVRNNMTITFNYGNGVINLPEKIIDCLSLCDSVDLKTLIILGSSPDIAAMPDPIDEIASRLDCRKDKVEAAISYWNECGIITLSDDKTCPADTNSSPVQKQDPPSQQDNTVKLRMESIPHYTGPQLEELTSRNGGSLKRLLDECASMIGKVLNYSESNKIAAMSDYLGLSDEHILLLFSYCRNHGKTSVPYIERVAYNLYDEGVDSAEKLDEYFKCKEAREKRENKLRSMFGIGTRAFTAKEKGYLHTWLVEYKYDDDVLNKAFEVTVNGTRDNSFNFSYMNSVLENWYKSGVKSLADAEAFLEHKRAENPSQNNGSFDTDEFFAAAVAKGKS